MLGQSDSALFTIEELKAIRKQQIRLVYCDSARVLLEEKDTINQQSIVKLNEIIETQRKENELINKYNHTLKLSLIEGEKKINKLKRNQRLLKIGFISCGIGFVTTTGLLFLTK